jgi:glc operon protein GlcG
MPLILPMKPKLNLAAARLIAEAAELEAVQNNWAVAIAIMDEGGRLLYFLRMDSTANASVEVAIAKALHAVNFRRTTRFHEELVEANNPVVLGVPGMVPLEGGIPIRVEDEVIGSIGVSGVQSPQDGQIAEAGIAALVQQLQD